MTDKFWKAYERRVCSAFGGNRRGADYGDRTGGKNDCTGTVGFSVEIKCHSKPTFRAMLDDLKKAKERRQYKCDVPVSVMKRKGDPDADAIVSFQHDVSVAGVFVKEAIISVKYDVFINEVLPLLKEKKILESIGF